MTALIGRIEFRSCLSCSIREACADTEMTSRRIMSNLWLADKNRTKTAWLSCLACTSANSALMASNLIFSWTALATLFLSNGSKTQGTAVTHWICGIMRDISSIDGKCLPSTQMYLFLHSTKLFLGKALASRTEITCLSQLHDTQRAKSRGIILCY